MTKHNFVFSTACAAALFAAGIARADVTPEQVWENWQSVAADSGQVIETESAAREGNAFVVRGLVMSSGTADGSVRYAIDLISFTDLGDGSVSVSMSDQSRVTLVSKPAGGESLTTGLDIATPGLVTTVSGTPDEMRYDYTAPKLTVTLTGIEGENAPKNTALDLVLSGLTGNSLVSGSDKRAVSSSFAADDLALKIAGDQFTKAEGARIMTRTRINVDATMSGLSGLSNSVLAGDISNPAASLRAGATTEGSFSYRGAAVDLTTSEGESEVLIAGTYGAGDLTFAMDEAKLAYGGTVQDARTTLSGTMLPVRSATLAYREGSFHFQMPVIQTGQPGEFALMTRLVDLTVSDDVWDLFDPVKVLPRDPMIVVLDTTGTATLKTDLLDESAVRGIQGAPADLNTLNLNALQLRMTGAELTGSGALTFDNRDTTTYPGVPAPTGKINLRATGVNGLLDKLTQLGFLPQDRVMAARMMMGMFAQVVPGEPDTMTSEVEFRGKGLFVNGMQLQ